MPVYQQISLSLKLDVVEICTLWHFRLPLLKQMFIKVVSPPQTIRDRNALPESLISSAENAEVCVAKFPSLVRDRDESPIHRSWGVIVVLLSTLKMYRPSDRDVNWRHPEKGFIPCADYL